VNAILTFYIGKREISVHYFSVVGTAAAVADTLKKENNRRKYAIIPHGLRTGMDGTAALDCPLPADPEILGDASEEF
jgi:hypothetical protein